MNENLFSFPGETINDEENPFGSGLFVDLGDEKDEDNPFADMSDPESASAEEAPIHAADDATHTQSKTPTVTPVVQEETKTPPQVTKAEEEENPLMAAMDLQEAKNAKKAAEPIFAQLPVFSYNGNEEPIENINQTFEELRLAKADDFPEFEEAQSVSWTVTYGKVSKSVPVPRKAKIGEFKREIETSKQFMDELKKAKNKHPQCIVKPLVKMQKKGVMEKGYKGVFVNLDEARRSDKTICFIPARNGRVYERRVNHSGEFITPARNVTLLDDIRAGFRPSLPKIPHELFGQAVSLFRCMMTAGFKNMPTEALVNVYWDTETEQYFLHVPHQKVDKMSVDAVEDNEALLSDTRYIHYADIHSHNDMPAVFSEQDDRDERANRIYMVVGNLDHYYPRLSVRICNGGCFQSIDPNLVLEPVPLTAFPSDWLLKIEFVTQNPEEDAA